MLSLEELQAQIHAYRDGVISYSDFADWFEDNSAGAYDLPELKKACIAVDAALSEFHFDSLEENYLKLELARAVRPFVLRHEGSPVVVWELKRSRQPTSAVAGLSAVVPADVVLSLPPAMSGVQIFSSSEVVRKPALKETASATGLRNLAVAQA